MGGCTECTAGWVGGCLHEPVIVNVCNDFLDN